MKKLLKSLILGFSLAVICLTSLHAQTATSAPLDQNTTATPAPSEQAPDAMTAKITDWVHAGQYAKAQGYTASLLRTYPNDQRLIKAKALLDRLLDPGGAATATPDSNQPTDSVPPAQPVANPNAEQLTGMDRVDYNALIELARQTQQSTDLTEQNKLLKQFMDESATFLQKHSNETLLWQLRAASAMSLNDPMAGYDAGQKLLALGAADSNDQNLQRLLAQLKNKGWMDEEVVRAAHKQQAEVAEAERLKAEHDKYTFPVVRAHTFSAGFGHLSIYDDDAVYDGSDGPVYISKDNVSDIEVSGIDYYFNAKHGKSIHFSLVTEDAVTKETYEKTNYPPSIVRDAIAEKWKFVSNGNGLKPPAP